MQNEFNQVLGDLDTATPSLREVSNDFLAELNIIYTGRLEKSKSGKYIARPDNFFTLKIQPRDQSIAITVRGTPDRFTSVSNIEIKDDQAGYSRFKVRKSNEVMEGINIIEQAIRKV